MRSACKAQSASAVIDIQEHCYLFVFDHWITFAFYCYVVMYEISQVRTNLWQLSLDIDTKVYCAMMQLFLQMRILFWNFTVY